MRTFSKASFLLVLSAAVLLARVNGTVLYAQDTCAKCIDKITGANSQTPLLATAGWCVIDGFRACIDTATAAGTTYPAGCVTTSGSATVFTACGATTNTEPSGTKSTLDVTLWGACGTCVKAGNKWCALTEGTEPLRTCVPSTDTTSEIFKVCNADATFYPSATNKSCPTTAAKDSFPAQASDCGKCMAAKHKNSKLVWCNDGATVPFKGCVDKTATTAKSCKFYKNQKQCHATPADASNTMSASTVTPAEMKTVLLKDIATCADCKNKQTASPAVANAKWCVTTDFHACVDTTTAADAGVHYPSTCATTALSADCTGAPVTTKAGNEKQDLAAWGYELCMQKRADATTGDWKWCVIKNATTAVFQDCVDTSATADEIVILCKTEGKGKVYPPATGHEMPEAANAKTLSIANGDCGKCEALKPVNDKLVWCIDGETFHGCVDTSKETAKACVYKKNQMTCHATEATKNTMKGMLSNISELHTAEQTKDCGKCMASMKTNSKMAWCVSPMKRACVDTADTTLDEECKKPANHHDCGNLATNDALGKTAETPTATATTAPPATTTKQTAASFMAGVSAISIAAAFGTHLLL